MPTKNSRPTVLCFAGLDPSGGAGLQADIEAIASCGSHALPITTCLTVQNTIETISVTAIDTGTISQQVNALLEDMQICACKIGVIPNKDIAKCIATLIQKLDDVSVIYDPVLAPSYGTQFSNAETLDAIKSDLLPHVSVITPNAGELTALLGNEPDDITQASKLCDYGIENVLATDVGNNTDTVRNILLNQDGIQKEYSYTRLMHEYHGSGCTLSSALASYLANKINIEQASLLAQQYTYHSLQNAYSIGQGQLIPARYTSQ